MKKIFAGILVALVLMAALAVNVFAQEEVEIRVGDITLQRQEFTGDGIAGNYPVVVNPPKFEWKSSSLSPAPLEIVSIYKLEYDFARNDYIPCGKVSLVIWDKGYIPVSHLKKGVYLLCFATGARPVVYGFKVQ